MQLPMRSGEKRKPLESNRKTNFELVASCLDRTPEPLQYTDRLRHTQPDDDSCFTPKRESLVQSYMASAQTPISALIPTKGDNMKDAVEFSDKKFENTDKKLQKI